MKWCWGRLPGGVVTWEAYQGFKVGEKGMADVRAARTMLTMRRVAVCTKLV